MSYSNEKSLGVCTVGPLGNCWLEVSGAAIRHNIGVFRQLVGSERRLMAVVKANGYGHGAVEVAGLATSAGADMLGVFSVQEGVQLREGGIGAPILVLGPTYQTQLAQVVELGLTLTVGSMAAACGLCQSDVASQLTVHLKTETGTHRQGLSDEELKQAIPLLQKAGVTIEGMYTHFADIEDTTDHTFAKTQLACFNKQVELVDALNLEIPVLHTACTAAAILFPETYFSMARAGIGLYGLWPSKETKVSAGILGRNALGLVPALTWKTAIAQVKTVAAGGYIGYGRTFRATRQMKIAVLPVGYADGYDRGFSNSAHTLIRGVRAKVLGRVCMNLTMVDVTDVSNVQVGDEVVLLGTCGDEEITAEYLASLIGTINYEIVTRAAPLARRIVV